VVIHDEGFWTVDVAHYANRKIEAQLQSAATPVANGNIVDNHYAGDHTLTHERFETIARWLVQDGA
jgi:hypothetical protein